MEATLYQRLGGADGIAAIVEEVVAAHMANPLIKARFLPYAEQPERLAAVKKHLRDFLGMGSGGPEHYDGKGMMGAHRGMNINAEEYMAATDDIMAVLARRGVDEATRSQVLAIAYSLKGEILRV